MRESEKKQKLVKELSSLHKKLNVERLYGYPGQLDTKSLLSKIAAILKNLDESDFRRFEDLRQHIYQSIPRPTRKHAAEQIDTFIGQKVEEFKRYDFTYLDNKAIITPKRFGKPYINGSIIARFLEKNGPFNYKKLVSLLKELNINYSEKNIYSSAALIRAILDHLPPLLSHSTFEEVVYNYSWSNSYRKYMQDLLSFRNLANDALHTPISEREDHLSLDDLPASVKMNTLLEECIVNGGKNLLPYRGSKKDISNSSQITVNLANEEISWANYAIGNYKIWDCFRLVLFINNYKSNKKDYVGVYLTAKSNEGIWHAKHFVFVDGPPESATIKADDDFEIGANEKRKITVYISDRDFGSSEQRQMPDIDKDTMKLIVKTESGKKFPVSIKPAWIKKG